MNLQEIINKLENMEESKDRNRLLDCAYVLDGKPYNYRDLLKTLTNLNL